MSTVTPITQLIVEKSGNELWGRIKVKDNLIVDSAPNLVSLKKQLKKLAFDLEAVEITDFEIITDQNQAT